MNGNQRMVAVPMCQRQGCEKPLPRESDRFYLMVRARIVGNGGKAVFCKACHDEITRKQAEEKK